MNEENTFKLVNAFPNLYPKYHPLFPNEEILFHFDCKDGWFNLLWELSEKLEAEIIRLKKEGKTEPEDLPHVQQVKEKYGTLCFYASFTEKMGIDIAEAEKKSETICEICGKPGKLNIDDNDDVDAWYWLMVRCDEHEGNMVINQ